MLKIAPRYFEITDFSLGMNWSVPPHRLDPRESFELKNFNLVRQGLEKRGGISKKYPTAAVSSTDVHSLYEYKAPNGTNYILVGIDTSVKAYYSGAWHALKSALTSGSKNSYATHRGMCISANGDDDNFKLWNTAVSALGIDPPTVKPSVAKQAANSSGISGKYKYWITYLRDRDGISIYCDSGDATEATLKKEGDTLILVHNGTGGQTWNIDLSNASYDTLTELQAYIDGLTGWSCTLWGSASASSTDLYDKQICDVLGSDNEVYLEYETLPRLESNPSTVSDEHVAGQTYEDENIYDGDGSTKSFSGSSLTLSSESIKKESVEFTYVISGQEYTGADDGNGNLEGDQISSGTIDYDTGAVALTFRNAPDNNTEILFTYQTAETVRITVTGTADTDVNKIVLYRTLNLYGEDADSTIGFKVTELANPGATTTTYDDTTDDNDLTTTMERNNTRPPKKTKFLKLYKDRMFYVNNPTEADGGSLVVFSKSGIPEACPSSNYQYFDREDGEEITGCAAFGDYFVMFKRNKIGVIEGEFEALYYISVGVGCIAPWAILEFRDKVIFLSEEGWMSFDGHNLINISEKVNTLIKKGYLVEDKNFNSSSSTSYSCAYYPEKNQFHFLLNTDSLDDIVMVGHFISNIYSESGLKQMDTEKELVAWTYHEYDDHTLTCLGTYTDSKGNMKLMAGASDGFVYNLDSGADDDGNSIQVSYISGWSPLGTPDSLAKTVRFINLSYGSTDNLSAHTFYLDSDFVAGIDSFNVQGGNVVGSAETPGDIWGGKYQLFSENYRVNVVGQHIRLRFSGTSIAGLIIAGITVHYRIAPDGVRFWSPTRSQGYRPKDDKLRRVLEHFKERINGIVGHLESVTSATDELVKVGASGEPDYLSPKFFTRSQSKHITINFSGIDHGFLQGLSDDDHTHYLLASGARALTGNWDAGNYYIQATRFISDVATGTMPLTVSSTTLCTNLNADKVDSCDVIDEDDMASDSDVHVPTQQSVKAYIDTNCADPNDVLLLDQTTPQTVSNGIPLLDQEYDAFSDLTEFVNKGYVDWAVSAIGVTYYMTDDTDGDTGYKICSLTPSADSETYIEETDVVDDELLGTWISDVGEAPSKLLRGIYDWFIFAEKTSGTKTLRLYWKLYERKTDDSEALIATSSESNELDTGVKTSYIIPLALDSDYTPDSGSRIVGKIYASVSGSGNAPTVKIYYQGVSGSRWEIPSNIEVLSDIFLKKVDHTKALHDALGIDADTVDGEHAANIVTDARVKAHFPDTIANILSDHDKTTHDALNIDADTVDGSHASDFASASHIHDDRYYTEAELNTSGGGGAVHWDNVTNTPSTYPPSSHTHPGGDITSQVSDADTVDGEHAADIVTNTRVKAHFQSHPRCIGNRCGHC
ncbi:MAG: hypothetical protein JRI45_06830 [Deltaproteobacteria bacterium]|nr:hypothetical protein [Deltaproteobacteria bacterium]